MEKYIKRMCMATDLNPWYWCSYGEKCYAFGVVEAYVLKEGELYPKPGTELEYYDKNIWIGENGTKMMIESWISSIEEQSGDTICQFIANAHAELMGEYLYVGG